MRTTLRYSINLICWHCTATMAEKYAISQLFSFLLIRVEQIPETLFNGMDELKELSLNNLGLAYISTDAFVSLQDSLTLLELRSNKIRTIPNAVQMLSHLECLDLSTNDIKTERTDGSIVTFSTGLKRLKRLRIKRNVPFCPNDRAHCVLNRFPFSPF